MEQMINENKIYKVALYCRLSKDDRKCQHWNTEIDSGKVL
jgi:hypothetical protein